MNKITQLPKETKEYKAGDIIFIFGGIITKLVQPETPNSSCWDYEIIEQLIKSPIITRAITPQNYSIKFRVARDLAHLKCEFPEYFI